MFFSCIDKIRNDLKAAPVVVALSGLVLSVLLAPKPTVTPTYDSDGLSWDGKPVDAIVFIRDVSFEGKPCEVVVTRTGKRYTSFVCVDGDKTVPLTLNNAQAVSMNDYRDAMYAIDEENTRKTADIKELILTKIIH